MSGARFDLLTPQGTRVPWDLAKYLAVYRARMQQQGRRSWSLDVVRHEWERTGDDGRVERRFLPPGDYVVELRAGATLIESRVPIRPRFRETVDFGPVRIEAPADR